MSKDEFTKLYVYMERRFNQIDERFESIDRRFDEVSSRFDSIETQLEVHGQEMIVLNYRDDCHERWIHQLADRAHFKLKHEA